MARSPVWQTVTGIVLIVLAAAAGGGYYWYQHHHNNSHQWSVRVQDNFLRACERSGGSTTGCTCAIDQLEDRYDETAFLQVETEWLINRGPIPPPVIDAIAACR